MVFLWQGGGVKVCSVVKRVCDVSSNETKSMTRSKHQYQVITLKSCRVVPWWTIKFAMGQAR